VVGDFLGKWQMSNLRPNGQLCECVWSRNLVFSKATVCGFRRQYFGCKWGIGWSLQLWWNTSSYHWKRSDFICLWCVHGQEGKDHRLWLQQTNKEKRRERERERESSSVFSLVEKVLGWLVLKNTWIGIWSSFFFGWFLWFFFLLLWDEIVQ